MRRARIQIPFYLSAVAALLAGCGEEAAPQAMPVPAVEMVEAVAETVTLTRELPGRTSAYLVAEVRPQVTGIVRERLFEEGALVEGGEVLYQLDDATYRAEYNRAKANLDRTASSLRLATINAERTRGLADSNAISQQDLDNALAALSEAEAEVAVAQAALESAEVLLGYTRITSPISGRIGKSAVTQGALVTANQAGALATVRQLDPIYVDVTQSSREMLRFRRALADGSLSETDALPVTIRLEDGTEYSQVGQVGFSEATVDPTTGSFLLRVVVPNPDHVLLPGMYVRATVGMGIREEAILVPQQAVIRGPSGSSTVMIVRENNTVEQRAVVPGDAIGNRWVIEHGLLQGDRVVTEGLQMVRPEMKVQIVESAQPVPDVSQN